jgi:hypothetical protein
MRVAIVLSVFILSVGWCVGRPVQSQAPASLASGEPIVTIVPPPAVAPAAVTFPTPAAPQRVQFERGTYGSTLTGTNSQAFLLWAAQGQTFSAYLVGAPAQMALQHDGRILFADVQPATLQKVQLPANGDYTLIVSATVPFTVGVEIR